MLLLLGATPGAMRTCLPRPDLLAESTPFGLIASTTRYSPVPSGHAGAMSTEPPGCSSRGTSQRRTRRDHLPRSHFVHLSAAVNDSGHGPRFGLLPGHS